MAESKHTPGPWKWLGPDLGEGSFLVGEGENVIAHDDYEGMWFATYDRERDAANARLIAASPNLLEKLSVLWRLVAQEYGVDSGSVELERAMFEAETAIAKATGEAGDGE